MSGHGEAKGYRQAGAAIKTGWAGQAPALLERTWLECEPNLNQAVVASWRGLTRSNPGRGGAGPREQRGADQRSTAASSTSNLEAGSCGVGWKERCKVNGVQASRGCGANRGETGGRRQ